MWQLTDRFYHNVSWNHSWQVCGLCCFVFDSKKSTTCLWKNSRCCLLTCININISISRTYPNDWPQYASQSHRLSSYMDTSWYRHYWWVCAGDQPLNEETKVIRCKLKYLRLLYLGCCLHCIGYHKAIPRRNLWAKVRMEQVSARSSSLTSTLAPPTRIRISVAASSPFSTSRHARITCAPVSKQLKC